MPRLIFYPRFVEKPCGWSVGGDPLTAVLFGVLWMSRSSKNSSKRVTNTVGQKRRIRSTLGCFDAPSPKTSLGLGSRNMTSPCWTMEAWIRRDP